MKPELFLADALGAAGQADAARAHRRQRRLLDGDRRHRRGEGRPLPARAHRRVREAGRGQRAVGPRRRQVRQHGRGRHLRPVDARLHQPFGRARAHRLEGRGQGPAQRGQEPVRAPQAPRHHHREGAGLADAVGSRSTSSSRARRPTARARSSSPTTTPPATHVDAGVGARRPRCARSSVSSPAATPSARRRARLQRRASTATPGITNPREQIDVAELYVPFSWYEPMWLEGHDLADPGEGWKMTDDGSTEIDRLVPGEPVGRRALVQPDRRVGHDPLRGGRAPGAGQGRRAPGRRRARSALGHAYGAMAQYFAMAVLSSSPSPW